MFRLLLITTIASAVKVNSSATASKATVMALQSTDFEVFGRVQGVFFRKCTKDQADKLGLRGWCKNTSQGTVLGHMQGPTDKMQTMMHWLKTIGSPSSQIDKAEFRNKKEIDDYTFNEFGIRKD